MARFGFKDEDKRLWSLVTATVRPHTSKKRKIAAIPEKPPVEPEVETIRLSDMPPGKDTMVAVKLPVDTPFHLPPVRRIEAAKSAIGHRLSYDGGPASPDPIEPKRKRRLTRERDPIEATLDLHGLNAIAAETRLRAFIFQAFQNDFRAILVITGKGVAETGLLKRLTPEWLGDPALSSMVAGISQAHARHGGTGAIYVALKRRRA
jgi:DNA-nicking Smr family endonuclease